MTSRSNSFSNFSESSYEYDDKDCSTATTSDRDEPLNPGHRNNSFNGLLGFTFGSKKMRKKKPFCQEKAIVGLALLVIGFVGMNWWMLSRIQNSGRASQVEFRFLEDNSSTLSIREELLRLGLGEERKPQKTIYARLLAKAAHSLAEGQKKSEPKDLWAEPYFVASSWKPCAEQRQWLPSEGKNGYIIVTANGGINQQRVAVCNIVAIARLLDATLVLPKFLYSSVWKDVSLARSTRRSISLTT